MGIDAHVGPRRSRSCRTGTYAASTRRVRRPKASSTRRGGGRSKAPTGGTQTISDWLRRDERGDVPSGPDLARAQRGDPLASRFSGDEPGGKFLAGDVRHGSVKRVASAVGEGPMAASLVDSSLASEYDPRLRVSATCQHVASKRDLHSLLLRPTNRLNTTRCRTSSCRVEELGRLDKLGVTGSSPVPPTSKAPLRRGFSRTYPRVFLGTVRFRTTARARTVHTPVQTSARENLLLAGVFVPRCAHLARRCADPRA
jgi:hypothetical protein